LDSIHAVFPEKHLRSFHAFADFISGRVRTTLDFDRLHRLGLNRICFGVESGNTELMERIQKPLTVEDVLEAVRAARAGGVAVSLIFIIGLGGRRYRDTHFEDSIRLLSHLPLGGRDRIYLSPLTLETDFGYTKIAKENDWDKLTHEDMDQEMNRWQEAVARRHADVSVSLYNIRHFSY
jgi:coproporphyrinogen III oxidase-like Fe-S oxidoreductase